MIEINLIQKELKKTLSRSRYGHSVEVGQLAKQLAKQNGWDPDLAYRAGLVHDCVKEWSPKKLIAYVRRYKVSVPGFEFIRENNPNVLHGYVGADYIKRKKWMTSPVGIAAVRCHTLGKRKMSVPEMIVYIADFAAKDRKYPSAKEARKMAQSNLRAAFRFAVSKKIAWNLKASKPVHPFAISVWNALVEK